MSKHVLPICKNPSVITSIHHAYPCAIIESKLVLDADVIDYEKYEWESKWINSKLEIDKFNLKLFEEKFGENIS